MNSFLQGKKILAATPLTRPNHAVAAGAPNGRPARTPAQAPAGGPATAQVEVVKEGDKVVRMIVTCACGERVEIECLYPAGS